MQARSLGFGYRQGELVEGFEHDVARILVFAQTLIAGLAKLAAIGPLRDLNLGDQDRPDPVDVRRWA